MVAASVCLKSTLITGIVVSAINALLMCSVFVEFMMVVEDYDDNAEKIIKAGAESNFNSTSEWYTTVTAEYDALSNFDKENVYCDVVSLLSDPDAQYDDAWLELNMTTAIAFSMAVGVAVISIILCCCSRCNPYYGVDMSRIQPSNPDDRMSKPVVKSGKPETPEEKAEADLTAFNSNTAILFILTGAGLALYWVLVERRSLLNGMDCQAIVYDCGMSGKCDIDDMIAPVALNSSMLAMMTTYPLMAAGWFYGVASLVFLLATGVILSLGMKNFGYLKFPLFWSLWSVLPFIYVLFLGDKLPVDAIFIALAIVFLPILFYSFYFCFSCWWSCRGYDKDGRVKY